MVSNCFFVCLVPGKRWLQWALQHQDGRWNGHHSASHEGKNNTNSFVYHLSIYLYGKKAALKHLLFSPSSLLSSINAMKRAKSNETMRLQRALTSFFVSLLWSTNMINRFACWTKSMVVNSEWRRRTQKWHLFFNSHFSLLQISFKKLLINISKNKKNTETVIKESLRFIMLTLIFCVAFISTPFMWILI